MLLRVYYFPIVVVYYLYSFHYTAIYELAIEKLVYKTEPEK